MIFQVPATLETYKGNHNRALKITFETQEGMTDTQLGSIASAQEKFGWLVFAVDKPMDVDELSKLPPLPEEETKSPAQRLRATLFRLYEQEGKQGDFNDFYKVKMERLIDYVKEKLT